MQSQKQLHRVLMDRTQGSSERKKILIADKNISIENGTSRDHEASHELIGMRGQENSISSSLEYLGAKQVKGPSRNQANSQAKESHNSMSTLNLLSDAGRSPSPKPNNSAMYRKCFKTSAVKSRRVSQIVKGSAAISSKEKLNSTPDKKDLNVKLYRSSDKTYKERDTSNNSEFRGTHSMSFNLDNVQEFTQAKNQASR